MNKFNDVKNILSKYYSGDINLNLSPATSYRSRCEFGYRNGKYTMVKGDKKISLTNYDLPVPSIQNIMEPLLEQIKANELLKHKLFQINFRAVRDVVLISLIYHKELEEKWLEAANCVTSILNVHIIGRSRKQIIATDILELEDEVDVQDSYYLYQDDKTFYQPNKYIMPKMVEYSLSLISDPKDLLELYCGSGTFTVPMSRYFKNIFATENNRASITYLNKAIKKNDIANIAYARLSDTELTEAFNGRVFRRMGGIDLGKYNFSHVLVDPPRSGLNENVTDILQKFDNIIYISCNPETFERDLQNLKDYKINKVEVFDQFSNTSHLELIALLTKV